VLLHPNGASSSSWVELGSIDALQAVGLRAVSLDAGGFGRSDAITDPGRLSPGTSTDDVAAVLDVLAIEAAQLCGFSLEHKAACLSLARVDQPVPSPSGSQQPRACA
jgi:pimeloyl-ACP methyl ester carboxylesterase